MDEMKKEAMPSALVGLGGLALKGLAAIGGGSAATGALNAAMYGPMLWDAAKWAKNKILPAVGRPGRYAANFPSPAPFQPGVLSSYGRYGGYGSVHSAELKERKLAFEAGIDRFCKEAGFDEEDRLSMHALVKKASGPASISPHPMDPKELPSSGTPHFLDLVGEEEPAKDFQEYTARVLAKLNPNRMLGYVSPALGGMASALLPGGNQLGADLSNRILTSIGGDRADFDRARKRMFLQEVMADPARFGAGKGMIAAIRDIGTQKRREAVIDDTFKSENLERYMSDADSNLNRLGEIIRLRTGAAFKTSDEALDALRSHPVSRGWASRNLPPPKPTPPAMGTGTPTDLSQPVINPVPPVERLPARAAPQQPGPVMPPPTPAPPPPGNVPPAQPSPQNTADFVPEGMAARMAQMKHPGGRFFQSGKGWGMVPGEPMELPTPPPPGGGGGGGGLMGMFRAFMGGEGGGGGAPGGGGMNLAQITKVPEVTAPPVPKSEAPTAPKPAGTSA